MFFNISTLFSLLYYFKSVVDLFSLFLLFYFIPLYSVIYFSFFFIIYNDNKMCCAVCISLSIKDKDERWINPSWEHKFLLFCTAVVVLWLMMGDSKIITTTECCYLITVLLFYHHCHYHYYQQQQQQQQNHHHIKRTNHYVASSSKQQTSFNITTMLIVEQNIFIINATANTRVYFIMIMRISDFFLIKGVKIWLIIRMF